MVISENLLSDFLKMLIINTLLTRTLFLVLLKQEINAKLAFWTGKQQEVVSKLTILQKDKKYPDEVQNYVAEYQLDAYRNVSYFRYLTLLVGTFCFFHVDTIH